MDEKSIQRRTVLKTLGAVGATATLVSSTVSAGERRRGHGDSSNGTISKRRATEIATEAVGTIGTQSEFEEWTASGVESPTLFRAKVREDGSVTYLPRAWVCPVTNRGEDAGYITIDAVSSDAPVLAYGKSTAPQRRVNSAVESAAAFGKTVAEGGGSAPGRMLYHGGVTFGLETTDGNAIDLRGGKPKHVGTLDKETAVQPATAQPDTDSTGRTDAENPPDWSGGTDDSISGVPNWTEEDGGGADNTSYGTGDDSWDSWDGCVPVAQSMVIGYHEGIDEWEDDEREALIDRLHDDSNTSEGGSTDPWNIDNGINSYSEGSHSYNGNTNWFNIKGNVRDAVDAGNPPVLSMANSPYTKNDKAKGHAVTVVGYREEDCGYFCSNFYHKVHNGYDTAPDRLSNGNWLEAQITRVQKE